MTLRDDKSRIADKAIADFKEHYSFPSESSESHMHDCIVDALPSATLVNEGRPELPAEAARQPSPAKKPHSTGDAPHHTSLPSSERDHSQGDKLLGELLARIFRDGGQTGDQFECIEDAVDAADALVAKYIAAYDASLESATPDKRDTLLLRACGILSEQFGDGFAEDVPDVAKWFEDYDALKNATKDKP